MVDVGAIIGGSTLDGVTIFDLFFSGGGRVRFA